MKIIISFLLFGCMVLPATNNPPSTDTLKFLQTLPNGTNYVKDYQQGGSPGTNRLHKPKPIINK